MVTRGHKDYEGIQSRHQKAEVSLIFTKDAPREPEIPRPPTAIMLADISKIPNSDSSISGSTIVAPPSPMQDEPLATPLSRMQIRPRLREEVAELERQAIIQEYQRTRAIFNDHYWPTKKRNEVSQFERRRTRSLQEEFRKVIERPVLARAEVTQQHRACTELLRLRLIEHLEQQREVEWSSEQRLFGETLREHFIRYSDLYHTSVNTALAMWIVEAGLG